MNPKITPHLWFQTDAREVANHYLGIFKSAKVIRSASFHDPTGAPCQLVIIALNGMELMLLSAKADFRLNDAFSLVVSCHTQEELDYYWTQLTADGGREVMCGWLTDKFGLSWQIVPDFMDDMMCDPDPERFRRVSEVVFRSVKFDFAELQKAYRGI